MPQAARRSALASTATAIWIAGLTTPVAYTVVGWLLRGAGVGAVTASGSPAAHARAGGDSLPMVLAIICGGWALVVAVLILPLRERIAEQLRFDPLRLLLVQFALIESIAILGLVMLVLGRSWPALLAFEGWALALMLLIRPSADDAGAPRAPGQER